jgi:hypothetical protein
VGNVALMAVVLIAIGELVLTDSSAVPGVAWDGSSRRQIFGNPEGVRHVSPLTLGRLS